MLPGFQNAFTTNNYKHVLKKIRDMNYKHVLKKLETRIINMYWRLKNKKITTDEIAVLVEFHKSEIK